MYVSITHLELKSITKLFRFISMTSKVNKQVKLADGIQSVSAIGFYKNFWTRTAWNSKEDMLKFMKTGEHAQAMKNFKKVANGVDVYGFETDHIPSWKEAKRLLRSHLR